MLGSRRLGRGFPADMIYEKNTDVDTARGPVFISEPASPFNYKPRHEREIPRRRPLFDSGGFASAERHRESLAPFFSLPYPLHSSAPSPLLPLTSGLVAF